MKDFLMTDVIETATEQELNLWKNMIEIELRFREKAKNEKKSDSTKNLFI